MEHHIRLLTEPWHADKLAAVMEIRCLREGSQVRSFKFNPQDEDVFEEAVDKAIELNETGWNVYVCVNPIDAAWTGKANDASILTAYFAFADADDTEASSRLEVAPIPPDFFVRTGQTPHLRLHAYWRATGIPDLEAWKSMQAALIQNFYTDPAIKNPSRIMRLAGTISYPPERKKVLGYVPELTSLQEVK
jgi:hypothetical protein